MTIQPDAWMLDSFDDGVEFREVDGSVERRNHFVFTRHKKTAAPATAESQAGQKAGNLSAYVGNRLISKNLPVGTGSPKKYLCSSDKTAPEGHPLETVIRTQVWEYYSPWEAEEFA